MTSAEAARIAGENPDYHHLDLLRAIDRREFPSWTLRVQIMPVAEAAGYRFNPFDLTKVWPHRDYPLHEVGRLTLDRNPDNYFADVEQVAFNPAHFVPGIGASPDKMLQGRLFAYGDTHRYQLGVNHTALPVNRLRATEAYNYGRDGFMNFDGNEGRTKNYEPNSFGGPVQTSEPYGASLQVHGWSGPSAAARHAEDNDFVQAGNLYRLMTGEEKKRLIENLAVALSAVTRDDIIERSVRHFHNADPDYGARLAQAIKELRAQNRDADVSIQTDRRPRKAGQI